MDTRAPPIAPRTTQERSQQQHQKQQSEEVTLPPLTAFPAQQRHQQQRTKFASAPSWRNGGTAPPPGLLRQQDIQRRRPYKVLGIGATPLMHACQQADRQRVLKLLREQEETIGYRDRALRSALHYCMDAATGGAVAQAAPELVDSPDAEGHTPLHLAVIAGDTQLVAVLLANGADVNAKDLEGHSVLHWATVCGEVECVRLVLAAGARPSSADLRGGTPLHYAAQCCGATATADLAVPKKVGLKVLQTLLEFGADVNARDEDGRQPILWAASAGSVEAVLALVRAGGSAVAGASDKDGLTALHCAASRGHARCIEALVNLCDAQPDHVDDNGCSALHYAATLGHADATALLLKLGADPNRQDRKGRTPALCAAAKGQLETLKILAQHGGSLHARTVRGTGVAHEAVASGRLELIKWLAKRRPSLLDVATQDGKTPLHVAALHGHLDACKLLLDSGARINALLRTSKGSMMTALDAALYRGHRDCAKLIQLHGGTTAQHLRSHKSAPTKVFAAKLRMRHTETSSDSELNDSSPRRRQRNHDPELVYEERWIERRTRRRANRRRLSRQDSRSFSEEELRHHSKSSTKPRTSERERRALSENARYDEDGEVVGDEVDPDGRGSRRRRHSRRRKGEASSGEESESEELSKSDEASSTVSDDSLEVVVVRRSLEKKSEKIVSGRKSKTPRESKAEHSKRASKKEQDKSKEEKASRKEMAKRKSSSQEQKQPFDGDSTSQDTMVEQVTIAADVHKNDAPDSSRDKSEADKEPDEQIRSKMDDILEKADELQNALLTKAADLRKDMEEMRHQMSQKPENEEKKDEEKEVKEDKSGKTSEEEKKSGKTSEEEKKNGKTSEEEKVDAAAKSEGGSGAAESAETTSRELSSAKEESPRSTDEKRKSLDQQSAGEVLEKKDKEDGSPRKDDESKAEVPTVEEKVQEKVQEKTQEKADEEAMEKETKKVAEDGKRGSVTEETPGTKKEVAAEQAKVDEAKSSETKEQVEIKKDASTPKKEEIKPVEEAQGQAPIAQPESLPGTEGFRFADESSSSSSKPAAARRQSRPSTGKRRKQAKQALFESSEERSPDRSAIVAVIESPEWDDEDDEELDKEIRQVVGNGEEHDEDEEDDDEESDGRDDERGIVRVLPSTSEEEMGARTSAVDSLPQLQTKSHVRLARLSSPRHSLQQDTLSGRLRQRRDSGGRDSGIEPSPRVSRIPRRTIKCCPNSERQQALHMDTITRDVQISLRRYHLERKIFFQLMELKRLQIRHGRANEQVLVKRQVESFHKAGMSGPALGVARYDQPFTFRHFESFLYEQLRRLQRRPSTPDWCTEAKQCTQKTHRCHHATSAYTSVPIYTYLGGGAPERPSLLPRIEGRGKGQMTVEVTHGEEKQVIALPSEKLDRTKRYYVTFTVRGDTTDSDKPKTPSRSTSQRNTNSV